MSYIIAQNRKWCNNLADILQESLKKDFFFLSLIEKIYQANVKKINPKYIFFAHWSYFIPKEYMINIIV